MRLCKVCGQNLRKADGSCVSSVPLFSETVNKEFCSALGVQSLILSNLLLKLGIVLNGADQQCDHFACKKCSRKIVNCYKLFSELQKTLANFIASDPTVQHNRTGSLERSPTGLTPESKRQRFTSANPSLNEKKASKTRKALFENVNDAPGDYSSLNDEILNLMNIQTDAPDECNLPPIVKVGSLLFNVNSV